MRTAADTREKNPVSAPAPLRLLGAGLRDFGKAWGVVRHPAPARPYRTEAAIGLIVCMTVVAVGYLADAATARWVMTLPRTVGEIFGYVTLLGTSGYIFALSVVVAITALGARECCKGQRVKAAMDGLAGRAVFVFAVNAVGGIAAQILKHLVGRARPGLMNTLGPFHFDLFSIKAKLASFPSGHTVTAFATAVALSYLAPSLRLPLLLVASVVAVSRLMVGAHYPSDVLAGLILGVGTTICLRHAFAARGLVFRRVGEHIRLRRAASPVAALAILAQRVCR